MSFNESEPLSIAPPISDTPTATATAISTKITTNAIRQPRAAPDRRTTVTVGGEPVDRAAAVCASAPRSCAASAWRAAASETGASGPGACEP